MAKGPILGSGASGKKRMQASAAKVVERIEATWKRKEWIFFYQMVRKEGIMIKVRFHRFLIPINEGKQSRQD